MRHDSRQALELLRRYHRDGDDRARGELAERSAPLARRLARRYADRGEALEDLEQVAMIGLLKAIDRFDCDRDVRFASFAVPTIAGELKRHFRDKAWMIRVPRDLQELGSRLVGVRERLTVEHGRPPSVNEMAAAAGVGVESVVEALTAADAYRTRSLDEPAGDGAGIIESLGADDEDFGRCEQRLLLRGGLQALPPREREILRLRFLEELTQREIADRVGLSQMHVSRLIRRSLAELRALLGEPVALPA